MQAALHGEAKIAEISTGRVLPLGPFMPNEGGGMSDEIAKYINSAFSGGGPIRQIVMIDRFIGHPNMPSLHPIFRVDRQIAEHLQTLTIRGVQFSFRSTTPIIAHTYGPGDADGQEMMPLYRKLPRETIYVWFHQQPVGGRWAAATEIVPSIIVAGSAEDLGRVVVTLERPAPGDGPSPVSIHDADGAFMALSGRLQAIARFVSQRNL